VQRRSNTMITGTKLALIVINFSLFNNANVDFFW